MSGTGNWQAANGAKDRREATTRHRGQMPRDTYAKLAAYPEFADLVAALGLGESSVDANGWTVETFPGGKRLWCKRWLAIATDSAPSSFLINAADLPVGAATMAAVDVVGCEVRASVDAAYYNARVQNTEAHAFISVRVMTVDGSDLDSIVNSVDLFVTLKER